jgi:hypothetical protein
MLSSLRRRGTPGYDDASVARFAKPGDERGANEAGSTKHQNAHMFAILAVASIKASSDVTFP